MRKTTISFSDEASSELRRLAASSARSVSSLVREAVQTVWLSSPRRGPVAVWTGPVRRGASEHDATYSER